MNHKTQDKNSIFQVNCPVQKGEQPFFFEWLRNGQTLKASPDVTYKIDNDDLSTTLIIKKIQKSDKGNYTCLVKNTFGSDSQTVSLTVKGK